MHRRKHLSHEAFRSIRAHIKIPETNTVRDIYWQESGTNTISLAEGGRFLAMIRLVRARVKGKRRRKKGTAGGRDTVERLGKEKEERERRRFKRRKREGIGGKKKRYG